MKTNTSLKRTLSALMAVIMVFTLAPCFAMARGADEVIISSAGEIGESAEFDAVQPDSENDTENAAAKVIIAGYDKEKSEFYKITEPFEVSVTKDTVTVKDIMDAAVNDGSLTYELSTNGQSSYIVTINNVTPISPDGWLFSINGVIPAVGADEAVISDGDTLLWYVGTPENGYNVPDWDSMLDNSEAENKLKKEAVKYKKTAAIPSTVQENSDVTALVVRLNENTSADSEITLSYESENNGIIKADSEGYKLGAKPESDTKETVTLSLAMGDMKYEQPITVTLYAADKDVNQENLLKNIAAEYAENDSDYWKVAAVSAYNKLFGGAKMSDKTKDAFVSGAVKTISETNEDTTLAMNIIALRSIGYDASDITAEDGSKINAAEKLANAPSTGNNGDAYRLLAYSACGYDNKSDIDAVIDRLLSSQIDSKGWSKGNDDSIDADTTGAVLLGLSLYYDENTDVTNAADDAVLYLSSLVQSDGNIKSSYKESNYGTNANTSAICAIGLEALGIDIKTDEHFMENGVSLFDGIMNFASDNEMGFIYEYSNETINDLATKQAAIAVMAAEKNGNIFDFSDMPKRAINLRKSSDGNGNKHSSGSGSSSNTAAKTINVYFTLTGDTAHGSEKHMEYSEWISQIKLEISENSTAQSVIEKALKDMGYSAKGFENGYISEITTPDGIVLGEYTNGEQSGWLYSINGESPTVGINDYIVKSGDRIEVYYTDNWSDTSSDTSPDTSPDILFPDVNSDDWFFDAAQFAARNNLIQGNEKGEFMPDTTLTRAMAVTILCRYKGANEEGYADSVFSDVSESDWFFGSVNWAAANNIVSGIENGLFAPNDSITREQLALILYNMINPDGISEMYDIEDFSDTDNISDWAKEAMGWAVDMKIISGMDNGTLAPQETATRAQFAMILMNLNSLTK